MASANHGQGARRMGSRDVSATVVAGERMRVAGVAGTATQVHQ